MTQNTDLIIMFTKYPTPGKVKTRLIGALGAQGAATIHSEMTRHVFDWLKEASKVQDTDLEVWFDGSDSKGMEQFLGSHVTYYQQVGDDLGARMQLAFEAAFNNNFNRVIIVGSDCPSVHTDTIAAAFDQLETRDIVLGPALDGGYYLVGMRKPVFDIFENMPWSSPSLLELTKQKTTKIGASLGLLTEMSDVDEPEDLHIWEEAKMSNKSFQDHYSEIGSHCYGCGRLNDHGLHIKSYWDGDETVCHFEPEPHHSAFQGYVYGGLIASLVDCHGTGSASAFAYRNAGQDLGTTPEHRFVTASLHVDYLLPTPTCKLELRGRAKEIKGRKIVMEIDVLAKGKLCAKGEVVAVEVNDKFIEKIVGATPASPA